MSFAFMPFYTGDYYRDTRHLSMLQHGAYRQLLDHCWDQRGPLPLNVEALYRITGAVSKEEQDAVRSVVAEYFVTMHDGYYSRRMQREIERAIVLSGKRSEAGKKGGETRAKHLPSKSQANAKQEMQTPTSTSTSTPTPEIQPQRQIQKPIPVTSPSAPFDVWFSEFWKRYPRKIGKVAADKVFKSIKPDKDAFEQMLAAVDMQRGCEQWTKDGGQFIPHPATWLRGRRWEDEITPVDASPIEGCE